ncbi:MAG: hypothetical protein U1D31_02230 [Patescibacteria group bacterium]|nr:hypothetical protein [bacterium]MDZ4240919.1 hypothetical protein [Patescibacteria group bacterium]
MKTKISFWLLAVVLSVFFAEAISGSTPAAFTSGNTPLILLIYGLHILVLGSLVFRSNPKRLFDSLFVAGVLFGFYEAYITKVIWNPTWGEPIFSLGGVALIETLMLVLWLHPIMSFIVPLALSERFVLGGGEIGKGLSRAMPELFSSREHLLVTAFVLGTFHASVNVRLPEQIISDLGISIAVVLAVLCGIFLLIHQRKSDFSEIVLSKSFGLFVFLLVLLYLALTFLLRPDALPGVLPQIFVLLCYVFLGFVLKNLLSEKDWSKKTPDTLLPDLTKNVFPTLLAFLLGALFLTQFPFFRPAVFVFVWGVGIILGIRNLFRAAVSHAKNKGFLG